MQASPINEQHGLPQQRLLCPSLVVENTTVLRGFDEPSNPGMKYPDHETRISNLDTGRAMTFKSCYIAKDPT